MSTFGNGGNSGGTQSWNDRGQNRESGRGVVSRLTGRRGGSEKAGYSSAAPRADADQGDRGDSTGSGPSR